MPRFFIGLVALVVALSVSLALSIEAASRPGSAPGCPLRIEAFEDGSARLYCAGVAEPIGRIDAESGRVRLGQR